MRLVACGGLAAMAAGGMYVHGGGVTSETYALSAPQAQARLAQMHVPDDLRKMTEHMPDGSVGREDKDGKTVWTFYARGHRAASFTAQVFLVDSGHARIDSDFDMSGDADELLKDKFMSMAKPFAAMGEAGMAEQLDSTMESRRFDDRVMARAMAGYVITNIGQIQASVSDAMDEAVKQQEERDRMSDAPRPGEPMLDPTPAADREFGERYK